MLTAIGSILLSLAPWLLLGMAIAGLLHAWLPPGFVRRHLGGRGGVFKAVALGVPLPLCSCGVIPAGLGLRKDGASEGAAVGFLISTPQTGVDSILVSAAFLGWPFAIFKVFSATVTGLAGGLLTDLWRSDSTSPDEDTVGAEQANGRGLRAMVGHALSILRSIWRWLVLGVLISAAIEVFIPPSFFAALDGWGPGIPMLAVLLISLPLYVCATASVPIAGALVAAGMPTGAALVFLMAGPATNVATLGAIYRGMGRRALWIYLGTIVVGSIGFGLLFDFVLEGAGALPGHTHESMSWWALASAVLLVGLLSWFALDDARALLSRWSRPRDWRENAMEVAVEGMKCEGCVSKLEKAFRETDGVTEVEVTLEPARAVVRGNLEAESIRRIIETAGFVAGDPLSS